MNLQRNISEINLKGIVLVLAQGNVAHLKRRNNVRLLRQFAIRGIDTLKDERDSINDKDTFDMVCAKYYEYSYRYCLNAQDKEEMHAKFREVLGIDIVELVERISPLGFKFTFAKSGSGEDQIITKDREEEIERLEKAVEEDEAS